MPLDSNEAEYANFIPEPIRRASQRAEEAARAIGMANVPPAGDEAPPPAAPPVVAQAPAAEPPPAPPAPAAEDWEQKYRTLQGKYDAEVPSLRHQVNTMQGQVEGLQRLVAAVNAPPAAAPAPTPDTRPASTTVVVPDEDVETYGQDLITATQRWMEAKFGSVIQDLQRQITALSSGHQQHERRSTQQSVLTALDADPQIGQKWRAINDDPAFLAWLDEVDPFSGEQRKKLLHDAYTRGDVKRTGEFFKRYVAEHTAVSDPPPAPAPHTPPPDEGGTGRPTLADLAVPGRASGPAPVGAPTEKRVWTRDEITAFYRQRQRGAFAGREAEANRLEADIIAATTEGRIR